MTKKIEFSELEKKLLQKFPVIDIEKFEEYGYIPLTKLGNKINDSVFFIAKRIKNYKTPCSNLINKKPLGEWLDNGKLIMSNHTSMLDIPFIYGILSNIYGEEFSENLPIWIQRPGIFTKIGNSIPILRGKEAKKLNKEDRKLIRGINDKIYNSVEELIKTENKNIIVFPQGTRNNFGKMNIPENIINLDVSKYLVNILEDYLQGSPNGGVHKSRRIFKYLEVEDNNKIITDVNKFYSL